LRVKTVRMSWGGFTFGIFFDVDLVALFVYNPRSSLILGLETDFALERFHLLLVKQVTVLVAVLNLLFAANDNGVAEIFQLGLLGYAGILGRNRGGNDTGCGRRRDVARRRGLEADIVLVL